MSQQDKDKLKFQQYCDIEGLLRKKSKLKLKSRYFVIRNNGTQLLYYEPSYQKNPNCQPKELDTIPKSQKEFNIIMQKTKIFQLKAKDKQEKDKWIEALQFIITYHNNYSQKQELQQGNMKEYWKKFDSNNLKEIKLEDEQKQSIDEGSKQSKDLYKGLSEKLLDIKGIDDYIKNIDEDILNDRLVHGILQKKKERLNQVGLGLVGDTLIKGKDRFLVLITKRSLQEYKETGTLSKGNPIDTDDLPPWLQLNSIYYFKFDLKHPEKDLSDNKGCIQPHQIISVKQHEIKQHKHPNLHLLQNIPMGGHADWKYGFEIKIKEQKHEHEVTYNYYSKYLTVVDRWVKAIEMLIFEQKQIQQKTQQQQLKRGSSVTKNSLLVNTAEDEDLEKKLQNYTESSSEGELDDSGESRQVSQIRKKQVTQVDKIKKQIMKESSVKLKGKTVILQLKRQMLIIYKNDKKILNETKHVILKDITSLKGDDNLTKFIITHKKGEELKFTCPDEFDREDWVYIIEKLKEDPQILIEDLYEDNQEKLQLTLKLNNIKEEEEDKSLLETSQNQQSQQDIESQMKNFSIKGEDSYIDYDKDRQQYYDNYVTNKNQQQEDSLFDKIFFCCKKKKKTGSQNQPFLNY